LSCMCVAITCSDTVSTASTTSPSMCAWPKSRQMPTPRPSRSSSTKCTSDPARDSSFGITSTATRTPSGSAARCSSSRLRRADARVSGGRTVIIEVRPRGEDLDQLEPVRSNLQQVVAAQPLVVKEVRRHPERSSAHKAELSMLLQRLLVALARRGCHLVFDEEDALERG